MTGLLQAVLAISRDLELPVLPTLTPLAAGADYRPATEPALLGGDWYDAPALPDSTRTAVIGDVAGRDAPGEPVAVNGA
ncbi:hypothetical protein [Kitasatospora aureofaciens]|uniref:hypothetical protein n=1 Tax=Kitasatospora aureofaciens TaxID=1894 RepID=UPI001C462B4A|nr:hypothetical protein [Kitasatospora aureofaciens]MBV6702689.1 hypothetical protein [Kitasatospora aureofaciens]